MEPSLNDMDDYHKPLKKSKIKSIMIFFGVLIFLYAVSDLVQQSFF